MPEGPEIWRVADSLHQVLAGKTVEEISFAFDELEEQKDLLLGEKVTGVEARSKALLTHFSSDYTIYSHNQLYGKWYVRKRDDYPDTNRSLRLEIHNGDHSALLYSASDIEILKRDELDQHDYLSKLGPDLLAPETTYQTVLERFRDPKFQNRKLSTLLLDQGFLAGPGNYLRSEILFYGGVHPSYRPADCTDEQIKKLAEGSLQLSKRSYKTGGITVKQEIVDALKREGAARREFRHYVFRRAGGFCRVCGSEIEMIKTGGRKLFFCPACQPE